MTTNEREAFDVLVDAACEAINKIHKVGKKRFKSDMTSVVKAVIDAQARAAFDQRQEVTDEVVDSAMLAWSGYYCDCNDANVAGNERDAMQAALQAVAQPITSVSDALNFLEDWALGGNTLHGDDIQRFHAAVERIAPSSGVPEKMCMYSSGGTTYCHDYKVGDQIIAAHEEYARGWNACREAMLSTSPQNKTCCRCDGEGWVYAGAIPGDPDRTKPCPECQPQQAVPDAWKLVPVEPTEEMIDAAVRDVDCQDSYYPHSIFVEDDAKQAWKSMLYAAPAYNGKKEG